MTCTHCGRANLEGGVRCTYCGTPFPPRLDFDLNEAASSSVAPPFSAPSGGSPIIRRAGFIGTLALLAFKLKSLFVLFKFGKIAVTLGSMLLFIVADAKLFGWRFGVGVALSIFVHEMGHVYVNWRKGIPQSAPMFIPFVGAVIFVKRFPDDPTIESESGAGGPAAGMLAALFCLVVGQVTGDRFWTGLASFGFVINLFNLVPFPPLDGSHISSVFSPKIWNAVLITLLLWVIKVPSAMLWLVLIVGFIFRLGEGDGGRHLLAPPIVRIRMAFVYIFLCVTLGYGSEATSASRRQVLPRPETQQTRSPLVASDLEKTRKSNQSSRLQSRQSITPQLDAFLNPSDAGRQQVLSIFRVFFFLITVGLWSLTAFLLASASNRRFGLKSFGFIGAMISVLGLIYVFDSLFFAFGEHYGGALLGAYFAAALVAFGSAVYGWINRAKDPALSLFLRTVRCVGWAAGTALLIAYGFSNAAIFGFVAVLALLFYGRFRWLAFARLATWAQDFGDTDLALRSTQRALALCHDPESAAHLNLTIARLLTANDCGGAALAALDARSQLLTLYGTPEAVAVTRSIAELELRTIALTLLERYEEALSVCEAILQAQATDPMGRARLLVVHFRLSQIALFRGWADEAKAQTEWCLRVVKQNKPMAAILRGRLALSDALGGNLPEAISQCEQALALSRESSIKAMVSSVRAEISLKSAAPAEAEKEALSAVKAFPLHLAYRYRYGVALGANGKGAESKTILDALAHDFPNEHWGRLSAEA